MTNKEIISGFYESFKKGDARQMAAAYHPDIQFEDPAFGQLKGAEPGAMWAMLIERSKGKLDISFGDVEESADGGRACWEAKYTFGKTGRAVHNKIKADFVIREGKIIRHTDQFSFWKWSAQALGPIGSLLGWTPYLRRKVQGSTRKLLDDYMQKASSQSA